jgi:hypothetical protein
MSESNAPVRDIAQGRIPVFADTARWDEDQQRIGKQIDTLGEKMREAMAGAVTEFRDQLEEAVERATEKLRQGFRAAVDELPEEQRREPEEETRAESEPGKGGYGRLMEHLGQQFEQALEPLVEAVRRDRDQQSGDRPVDLEPEVKAMLTQIRDTVGRMEGILAQR